MIIHPRRGCIVFFFFSPYTLTLSLQPVCLSVIKFINTLPFVHTQTHDSPPRVAIRALSFLSRSVRNSFVHKLPSSSMKVHFFLHLGLHPLTSNVRRKRVCLNCKLLFFFFFLFFSIYANLHMVLHNRLL